MIPLQFALRRRMMMAGGNKKCIITTSGTFSGGAGSYSAITLPDGTVVNKSGTYEVNVGDTIILSVAIGNVRDTRYYAQITVEGAHIVRFQDLNTTKTYEYVVNSNITITGGIRGNFMPQLVLTKNI